LKSSNGKDEPNASLGDQLFGLFLVLLIFGTPIALFLWWSTNWFNSGRLESQLEACNELAEAYERDPSEFDRLPSQRQKKFVETINKCKVLYDQKQQ
jgi:hypothetical protein